MEKTFAPVSGIHGKAIVPGDKSISHRALLLAAMAGGASSLKNLAPGADVASTARCMADLGCEIDSVSAAETVLTGIGWRPKSPAELYAGNSGTTMRLLTGALAGRAGSYRLSGDESLSTRPMARVAVPLRLMGAEVELLGDSQGCAPVKISGASLRPIDYASPVASAQVKGAILFAALQADGTTRVTEPFQSRDHTEKMLRWLGVPLESGAGRIEIQGYDGLFSGPGFSMDIPGDFSSAAFLLTAACLKPGSRLTLVGTGVNPTRTGLLRVLEEMGASVDIDYKIADPEPAGNVAVSAASLHGTQVGGELIPAIIDELGLVALVATQAEGLTLIKDAQELRTKESDRISVLSRGLQVLGASIEERPDGLAIHGPTPLKGGRLDPHGDHRMALTFAIAGLIGEEPVTVQGWECTEISYPSFEDDLKKVIE